MSADDHPGSPAQGRESEVASQGYPKTERLRKRPDFLRVQTGGIKFHTRNLTILHLDADGDRSRFGVTVSKKVGRAHVRVLVKRRLREIYRTNKAAWPVGVDMVVIARPSAATASFADLREDMLGWASRGARRSVVEQR